MARRWIDLTQISFASFRGVVRIGGKLCLLGDRCDFRAADLEILEGEILRVSGVKSVFFELDNWRKNSEGEWTGGGGSDSHESSGSVQGDGGLYLSVETRSKGAEEADASKDEAPPGGPERT